MNLESYKHTSTNLLELPKEDVQNWIKSFDDVLTDCDGVIWLNNNPIEGSTETVNKLIEIKKKIFLVTNNSTKTRKELLEKALRLGYNVTEENIVATAHAAALYLKNRKFNKRVYVVGSTGISQELDNVGIKHTGVGPDPFTPTFMAEGFEHEPDIGAVIVGFDEHISFPKLCKAASYLDDPQCIFLATNTDERFPMPGVVVPGTGCIVRAVETSSDRCATLIGKPNPNLCDQLISRGIITPKRTLMIGDRCNTDILMGSNCGFQTLLVGTGIHTQKDVDRYKEKEQERYKKLIPDFYLPKLEDLLQFL